MTDPLAWPPTAADWPGRELGLPVAGEGSIADIGERIGARAIDAVAWFLLVLPLVGAEAAIRAGTGTGPAPEGGDALESLFGFVLLVVLVLYDPITTRLLGATPGKRAVGLTVVRATTAEPAGLAALAGRNAIQLVLWSLCFLPGVLDMRAAARNKMRQGWHDQVVGSIVVRTSKRRRTARAPVLREPWQSLLEEARAAQDRFTRITGFAARGPVRDRMTRLQREVERSVHECEKGATRGAQLADLADEVDLQDAEARALAARRLADDRPNDGSAALLADALESEAASARRLHDLVLTTERRLRLLVSQLSDAANRGAEVVMELTDTTRIDSLIDELAALHAGLAEAATMAGGRELPIPPP